MRETEKQLIMKQIPKNKKLIKVKQTYETLNSEMSLNNEPRESDGK